VKGAFKTHCQNNLRVLWTYKKPGTLNWNTYTFHWIEEWSVTLTRNKIEVGTYKASLWPMESVVRMGTVTTPIKINDWSYGLGTSMDVFGSSDFGSFAESTKACQSLWRLHQLTIDVPTIHVIRTRILLQWESMSTL
jgi:hypothetical protein